ncbi:hypothetical protein [Aurantibacillus circumpalustris]|uniref:hypothetical protein n=1 Tax=Aurantibacillus circumpalustris TaxID=3036359 RepID=UPI00295C2EDB|nr:hypothetical protein [Aurantibacillus circumpalustris]
MELVIKLYKDKPSKIGIKYNYEYQAVKAYEDLITNNSRLFFRLKIERQKTKLYLELVCEQSGSKTVYKDLEYKLEHLKRLQDFIKEGSDLQFVHVFSKANTLMIAKPFRKSQFVTLTGYEIIGSENFIG